MQSGIKVSYWSERVIINLKKEGIPSFDRVNVTGYELIDNKYLCLTLEFEKRTPVGEEDACQKER